MTSLTLHMLGGNDTVIIDLSGGNPIPPGGLIVDGGPGNDTLTIQGNASAAIVLTADGSLTIDGKSITLSSVETLDLTTHSAILHATPATRNSGLATLTNLIAQARNTGQNDSWTGPGITSSTAAQSNGLTTLGILFNDNGQGQPIYTEFAGQAVGVNDILIKYTYSGDLDLNGLVDGDDYFRIDSGYAIGGIAYSQGDIDYNNSIDGDDYFLIDRSFAQQAGPLAGDRRRAAHHLLG